MKKKLLLLLIALLGTLSVVNAQREYDFVNTTIVADGASEDGTLVLGGDYSPHGYGLNMKDGATITISVDGSCTFKFLGSSFSHLYLECTTSDGEVIGIQNSNVVNDKVDTFDFVYDGSADVLTFTAIKNDAPGNDIYLPLITVIPAQSGIEVDSPEENIIYTFDFGDGSIVPTDGDGKTDISKGLIEVTVGSQNAYQYNGTEHGTAFKEGNQLTFRVAGNSYIKVGGCEYSNGTLTFSSASGEFDVTTASQIASCYHDTGATTDFLYVGEAGEVTIDFTGANYIPYIAIVPYPYEVDLVPWVQKSGKVTVNGVEIDITMGATSTDAATVTVSEGTVISATAEQASIRIDLGGKELSDVTITHSGAISEVAVSGNKLVISYEDEETKPYGYEISVADTSKDITAEPGKTYSYNFADGSVLPQISYESVRYDSFFSEDGILTLNSNTDNTALQFGYHDSSHGAVMFSGNSMDIIVAGSAIITFGTCQYGSATDAVFVMTDASGTVLGSVQARDTIAVCSTHSFSYTGEAGVITATLSSVKFPTAEIYIHGVTIENAAEIIRTDKIDVWDFGGAQFDEEIYTNRLNEDIINSWFPDVEPGTLGVDLSGGFTAGVLSWVGGSNDRIRSTNTNLTRYDDTGFPASYGSETFTGCLYVNSSGATNRYLGLTLSADDEVTLYVKSQENKGRLTFEYMSDESQTDVAEVSSSVELVKFVAKKTGAYHIYDTQDKPFYYRILRRDAIYATLSGALNLDDAPGIPDAYTLILTNEAGKEFTRALTPESTEYSIEVPAGYTYKISLGNANGYIVGNGNTITIEENTTRDIVIEKVLTKNLSGSIQGLSAAELEKVDLIFTPENEELIYVPMPEINVEDFTYRVDIEPNTKYFITATGVNDYRITENEITIADDNTFDIVFEAKPIYKVNIATTHLEAEHLSLLSIKFTNLHEAGYSYTFTNIEDIYLRDGVYSIACSGLDAYPLELAPTSNVTVDGGEVTKHLEFRSITNWSFDDKVIDETTTAYKGMLFSGDVKNEMEKGHLTLSGDDATAKVPMNPGEKLIITYYYTADFCVVEGDTVRTSSESTSLFETVSYVYEGSAAGYLTISNVSATITYIPDIKVVEAIEYAPVITVGTDKEYQTINEALAAVRAMTRPDSERVKIMVDPGNYEEMLVIDVDSVSIINASATPSISLSNKGVDISENAVRITSYYGHGYDYYSMATNQKWSEDALRVNKENGYVGYNNVGSGTTNDSYWNATVVVTAPGFEASYIIFENSFNQYISRKESEDVVVEWEVNGKGTRPTDYGNTAVQDKSFVERAAAIAYTAGADKSILNYCRVVGRQDSFYGAEGVRIVAFRGSLMGGTDYLFGGMTLVAYQSDLAMNTSDASSDRAYITAAQQGSERGYLLYECTVTSAQPGTETASAYLSKPGYLGRPWLANTSEVVFYNTTIKATNSPGYSGKSMIEPVAWLESLGGASEKCYEYGTIEESGEDNSSSRASWAQVLTAPTLADGTAITTFNFTKGEDDWDPIPTLIANTIEEIVVDGTNSELNLKQIGNTINISGVNSNTTVSVYTINGTMSNSFVVTEDTQITLQRGFWIVRASNSEGQAVVKALIP